MKYIIRITFFGLALVSLAGANQTLRFDGYKVFKAFINESDQYHSLKSFEKSLNLNFWKSPHFIGDECNIMVSPEQAEDLEKVFQKVKVRYATMIDNVQKLIDVQKPKNRKATCFDWRNYHTLDKIHSWVKTTAQRFHKQVSLFSIGKSYEGRDIKGMKISYKKGNKAIFIEAAIHGNEWISAAVITYIIDKLLVSRDPRVRDIAENLDWYIIPVLNVDGYVYTHEVDRTWRKSRQPHHPDCVGADLNRNFDFQWMSAGASDDPCAINYAGPYAQSEPEIDQLTKFINTLPKDYIKIYMSMHSYSQLVLSPWGNTEELPEGYDDMMFVANGFIDAATRLYGTPFNCGSTANVLYKVSGAGKDWAFGVKKIPIPFTLELRDRGTYGFLLPPEQILPSAKEALEGFVGMIHAARKINIL